MCLAVPMKIEEFVDNNTCIARADQATQKVEISLLKNPQVGDYIIVHAGFAIEKLDEEEAQIRIDLFNELAEVQEEESSSK